MKQKKTKVLHILTGGKSFTGVSSYLYQYYKNMDRERIHFDFLFSRENSLDIHKDEPIFYDSKFYALNAVNSHNSTDYVRLIAGVKKVLGENTYDIVIVNTSVIMVIMACLIAAEKYQDVTFVAHAHNTEIIVKSGSLRGKIKSIVKIVDYICRRFVVKKSSYLLACSEEAGRVTFGDKAVLLEKFRVINDAIDTDAFVFNELIRDIVRQQLGVRKEETVYGSVGKLSYRKNQVFLLKVFEKIHNINPQTCLWLVGEGPERETLEQMIKDMGLEGSVTLLGQRSDVNELMQGMDCFVFTTISEGLGIVAVEAQATGLTTIVSDGVPKDALITELIVQIPLSVGPQQWADHIMSLHRKNTRKNMKEVIIRSGYDIETEAKKFTDFLTSI